MTGKNAENEGEDLPRDLGEYNGIAWRPHKNADGPAGQEPVKYMDCDGEVVSPEYWRSASDRRKEWYSIPLYAHPAPSQEGHAAGPARSAPDEALIEEIGRDALRVLDASGNYLHTDAAVKWAIREYISRSAGKEKG